MFKVGDKIKANPEVDYNSVIFDKHTVYTVTNIEYGAGNICYLKIHPLAVSYPNDYEWNSIRFILAEKRKNPTYRQCLEILENN